MNKVIVLGILCCGAVMYGVQKFRTGITGNMSWFGWGSHHYGKETIESLEVNGSTMLDGTRVLGLLSVNGSVELSDAFVKSLNANGSVRAVNTEIGSCLVNGSIEVRNCVVREEARINGALDSTMSTFHQLLSVAAEQMSLRASTVESIVIRPISTPGTQTVTLYDNTHVRGSILFESGNGEVIVYKGSRISGEVRGGKIIQK